MKETVMRATILVAYEGEGFYPPPDSIYTHNGHDYVIGELMHMEIRDGAVKSHMRAQSAKDIRYFEFRCVLPMTEPAEGNVLHMHPQKQAHA